MKDIADLQEGREHGTFYFPFEYYMCTIPETFTNLGMHWHEEMEIALVQKGRCTYHIDLCSYEIEEGDLIILSPHMLHGVSRVEKYSMESDSFVFSLNMLGYTFPDLCTIKYLHPIVNQKRPFPVIIKPSDEFAGELRDIFLRLKDCFLKREMGYELEVKAGLFYFFSRMIRCAMGRTELNKENLEAMDKIKRVLKFIQENYQNAVAIKDLAEICHFSEYHFMRFFKKNVDMTCIEYLNDYRLIKSLEQLENASGSITEIAFENGFNSIAYFNRLFKKRFGMTPGEYRKGHV